MYQLQARCDVLAAKSRLGVSCAVCLSAENGWSYIAHAGAAEGPIACAPHTRGCTCLLGRPLLP